MGRSQGIKDSIIKTNSLFGIAYCDKLEAMIRNEAVDRQQALWLINNIAIRMMENVEKSS